MKEDPVEEQPNNPTHRKKITPKNNARHIAHTTPKSSHIKGSASQVTFPSKNGICQGTTVKPKTSNVTHIAAKKAQQDIRDYVMQNAITKEEEGQEATEGVFIKVESNTTDTHKDTDNPADQLTFEPPAISPLQKHSKPIKPSAGKVKGTLAPVVPPDPLEIDPLGFIEEPQMVENISASTVKASQPDDSMLYQLLCFEPPQDSQGNTGTGDTVVSTLILLFWNILSFLRISDCLLC